jgi:hypothetical protein
VTPSGGGRDDARTWKSQDSMLVFSMVFFILWITSFSEVMETFNKCWKLLAVHLRLGQA